MPSYPTALVLIAHFPRQLFTYVIPETLRQNVHSGSMVHVPFGSNVHIGLIVEIIETTGTAKLKTIESMACDSFELSSSMLSLARWMASYYLVPVGICIQLMLPPFFKHRVQERFLITPLGRMMASGSGRGRATQHAILTRLQSAKHGLTRQYLRQHLGSRRIASALTALKRNGHVENYIKLPLATQQTARSRRRRAEFTPANVADHAAQYPRQNASLPSPVASSIRKGRSQTFVLQAPLENRTSVYLQAIQETIAKRRSCLVIFPHATQAHAFFSAARLSLGERISDWFGTRTSSHRTSEWYRVRSGDASVVIGTRLSVLGPTMKLGLVIVDEEHDFRHKVDHEPRFHTREIALARASREAATVILGSLHPSVEAIYMIKFKKAVAVTIPSTKSIERASNAKPDVSVKCIDMKTVRREGRIFSEPLLNAINTRLQNREPVILFQPRRGFARTLWCRDCGYTNRCARCSVALTYYKRERKMLCHICGESHDAPHTCSYCSGTRILPMGFGTEGVDEEIQNFFPDARIVRMDRDLIRSEAAAVSFMNRLNVTGIDVLIGTSMLLDIVPRPHTPLIGVISADTMLHMPDFRAAERAFHQLMALKAFVSDGEMLIQTLNPGHPMLESVTTKDSHRFYANELAMRRELSFPPFNRLICLRVAGEAEVGVEKGAAQWADHLRQSHASGIQEVLGPIPAPYSRVRGRYRYQILVKEPASRLAAELAHSAVENSVKMMQGLPHRHGLTFDVDVDPQVFL